MLRPRVSLFFNKNKYRFEVRPLHDNDPRPWPRGLYICVCWVEARATNGVKFPASSVLRNGTRREELEEREA